jgi:predicted RNA binding protein YcfA (HicA-like mRNA interferase family)
VRNHIAGSPIIEPYDYGVKVRDIIKVVEADDWRIATEEGSHRQFNHPSKPGRVTIAGKSNRDMPIGTLKNIYRQAQIKES